MENILDAHLGIGITCIFITAGREIANPDKAYGGGFLSWVHVVNYSSVYGQAGRSGPLPFLGKFSDEDVCRRARRGARQLHAVHVGGAPAATTPHGTTSALVAVTPRGSCTPSRTAA